MTIFLCRIYPDSFRNLLTRTCCGPLSMQPPLTSNWASEATPTLECSIEISHDIYIYSVCLVMTSEVLLTGPSGKTLVVRALLDSGSCLSIISTKAMKTLAPKKLDTSVIISGIESANSSPARPMTNFVLSSLYRKDWRHQVTAAAMPKVTCDLPLQGACTL